MTTDTPFCRIVKLPSAAYGDLFEAIDRLLAVHPEADELTMTCREIAELVIEINEHLPFYASRLELRLRHRRRLLRQGHQPVYLEPR